MRGLVGIRDTLLERILPFPHERKQVIGKSVQGKPIECHEVGSGPKKAIFVAAIHGKEVLDMAGEFPRIISSVHGRLDAPGTHRAF